jgi:excinuclease ABC subunit A
MTKPQKPAGGETPQGSELIEITGARVHNLKNVSVSMPRNKLIVITGLSGSGKSSLAFDTLYAEGQRRYVESLSAYARQFLGQVEKPDVDRIDGLSPAIAIDQKTTSQNPRSTVGTITEIHDHLRLLYARVGKPHCPQCRVPLAAGGVERAVDDVCGRHAGEKVIVYAPIARGKKGTFATELAKIAADGYSRVRIDGTLHELPIGFDLEKNKKHDIAIAVDRISVKDDERGRRRLTEALDTAVAAGGGNATVEAADGSWTRHVALRNSCPQCGVGYMDLEPKHFSFNSPFGACTGCDGIGYTMEGDETLCIGDPTLPVAAAVLCFNGPSWSAGYQRQALAAMLYAEKVSKSTTWKNLDDHIRDLVLNGSEEPYTHKGWQMSYAGILPWLSERRREAENDAKREQAEQWMSEKTCRQCSGGRLAPYPLAVTVGGKSIVELEQMSIDVFSAWLDELTLDERDASIAGRLLREISARSGFLLAVGLSYLSLDRASKTLSGGEAQRIRLASQVGSGLVGVLYVLDEPSIGLHPRDNQRLLTTLQHLRDLGNTVVVVEHDEETIMAADYVIDVGPGAGEHGGHIVAAGSVKDICAAPESLTGAYLSKKRSIPVPAQRRSSTKSLKVVGARENNLRNIDVEIPLGCLVAITGVSGSGKSTLIGDILRPALLSTLHGTRHTIGAHTRIEGVGYIDKLIDIDQSPIGRTPRSNPATYTGVFDKIRALYASTSEAQVRGWSQGRFSFNVNGGRCESCSGDGDLKIEMHFLPDVYVPCEACLGTRYRKDTLEIVYRNKNIADVLAMSAQEGRDHFAAQPSIVRTMNVLCDVGLGYTRLGQSATHLSGGEAQRIKLAEQLQRRSTGKTLYLLDEPTTGLHFEDVAKLVVVLDRLVDAGNTVVVIEHNLDVIKRADWVIDLGPEGGTGGGAVVATGTPEKVSATKGSWTGEHLRTVLPETSVHAQTATRSKRARRSPS